MSELESLTKFYQLSLQSPGNFYTDDGQIVIRHICFSHSFALGICSLNSYPGNYTDSHLMDFRNWCSLTYKSSAPSENSYKYHRKPKCKWNVSKAHGFNASK